MEKEIKKKHALTNFFKKFGIKFTFSDIYFKMNFLFLG